MSKSVTYPKPGFVYFIGNIQYKILKIGFTSRADISKRIKELQTGSAFILSLFKSIKANTTIEKLYHSALYRYSLNANSEWFRLCLDTAYFCQLSDDIISQLTLDEPVRKYNNDSSYSSYSSNESLTIDDLYAYM